MGGEEGGVCGGEGGSDGGGAVSVEASDVGDVVGSVRGMAERMKIRLQSTQCRMWWAGFARSWERGGWNTKRLAGGSWGERE